MRNDLVRMAYFPQKKFEDPKMALAGIEPGGLSITKLTEQPIPEDWNEQRRLYGFPTR